MLLDKTCKRILLALDGSEKHVSALLKDVGGSALTLEQRLSFLVKNGFLKENRMDKFPFKRVLSLSEKGKYILNLMKEGKI